jgi:hypothetical protein
MIFQLPIKKKKKKKNCHKMFDNFILVKLTLTNDLLITLRSVRVLSAGFLCLNHGSHGNFSIKLLCS